MTWHWIDWLIFHVVILMNAAAIVVVVVAVVVEFKGMFL
jgi:hypothetical protein